MKTKYIVMIQNDVYPEPEICLEPDGTELPGIYESELDAKAFIQYMVEVGYPREDYFICEVNRIEVSHKTDVLVGLK